MKTYHCSIYFWGNIYIFIIINFTEGSSKQTLLSGRKHNQIQIQTRSFKIFWNPRIVVTRTTTRNYIFSSLFFIRLKTWYYAPYIYLCILKQVLSRFEWKRFCKIKFLYLLSNQLINWSIFKESIMFTKNCKIYKNFYAI